MRARHFNVPFRIARDRHFPIDDAVRFRVDRELIDFVRKLATPRARESALAVRRITLFRLWP